MQIYKSFVIFSESYQSVLLNLKINSSIKGVAVCQSIAKHLEGGGMTDGYGRI